MIRLILLEKERVERETRERERIEIERQEIEKRKKEKQEIETLERFRLEREIALEEEIKWYEEHGDDDFDCEDEEDED